MAPQRNNPSNQFQFYLYDAAGQLRFSVQRDSVEGGQARYQVTQHERNALGQTVSSTSYAATVALGVFSEAAINAAVGTGDPSQDRVSRFVYDVVGHQIYALHAVTLEAGQRNYQVIAQQFDALGRVAATTTYATAVAVNAFDTATIDAAVNAVADGSKDRASAVIYDAVNQVVYSVRRLGPGLHQVAKQDYDALGQVVMTTQYASAVGPLAQLDLATMDSAVTAVAGADDREVQYVYDAVGRQRFVLQTDSDARWTVSESRYDVMGNVVESRRYDQYVTQAWVATVDTANSPGVNEQEMLEQLSSLGYSDNTPNTLVGLQRTRFAYDTQNQLRFTIDALGSIAENLYDALGNVVMSVRLAARPTLAQPTENVINAAVGHDDANNQMRRFAYDASGRLRFNVQVMEPNVGSGGKHQVTEQRYDAFGQLVERRAYATALGHLTAYDEVTIAAATVPDALNDRGSAVAYDAGGRQAYTVRELRDGSVNKYAVTKHVYDALGQLVQRIKYAVTVALTQFDKASIDSAVVRQLPYDRTTTYVHDAAGRLRFEVNPDLSFRESVYDALSQVTQTRQFDFKLQDNAERTEAEMVTLRANHVVGDGVTRGQVHTYDAAGRLTSTVDASNNIERYEYNTFGDRASWTDKNGNSWTYQYDHKGQTIKETSPPVQFTLSSETVGTPTPDRLLDNRFTYDSFGNLIQKIETANFPNDARTTDFLYDTVGRLTSTRYHGYYDAVTGKVEQDPTANRFRLEATTVYDTLGNAVRTSIRTSLNAFQYTYRTYDRQAQVVHDVNALNYVTHYTYTSSGEQETVTRYGVTITGTPANGMYWTASEIDPQLNDGYDENGNLLPDPSARTITMAYDKLGRKISVTQPNSGAIGTYYSTHTPGDASQANYYRPNATDVVGVQDAAVTRYEYNTFGDLTRQRVRINNIVEWQDTSFAYDAVGRKANIIDAAGYVTNMLYDTVGNVVSTSELTGNSDGNDRTTGFVYNVLNQQARVDRYGLRYTDANGIDHGVVARTSGDGGHDVDPDAGIATTVKTTTYDGYGKILGVTDGLGNVTSMRYNALGQLVEVIEPARLVAPITANDDSAVDPFRNQIAETPITSITVDAFGRTVGLVRATAQGQDARTILQAYDAGNNLISTTDAEGNVKFRSYDHAGRVLTDTQPINADLGPLGANNQQLARRYAYDALGQLTDTLDVYLDGSDLMQSGQSVVYNAFGEVVQERRKWGSASQSLAALNTATVAFYEYDNAGQVLDKEAADGLTVYYYNLQGQVTREEKRGNVNANETEEGLGPRITETQYDVLGRAIMIRRPAFDAGFTAETGPTVKLVTPYSERTLDRWGNLIGLNEGGYEFVDGQPNLTMSPFLRDYRYDDNNQRVYEGIGQQPFVSASGVSATAMITKFSFRDLQGNVVKEVDEAREQSGALISSRTRHKEYTSVGQLSADIDAIGRKVEYAYNVHGDRLGTRNALGTVLFDRYDRNGNIRFHGVLRTTSTTGVGEYNSFAGTGTIVRTYLNAYLYDQANRRFASKNFTEEANDPWSYTWLDGRNLGIVHRDEMGIVTQCRYDQFGNKSVEIDGAGARKEWKAATTDYVAGRIETYSNPADNSPEFGEFGEYLYNNFGELKVDAIGNTMTQYHHHKNGLLLTVTMWPTVTAPNDRETTTYSYDPRGQLTSENRITPNSSQVKYISYDNQGRLVRAQDQNKMPAGPTSDVRYSYDEWNNIRRIQATYTQTIAEGPQASDSWYAYDTTDRITISNGTIPPGQTEIRLKMGVPGSVQIAYDSVGRRSGTTEYEDTNSTSNPQSIRSWDTMRDEHYEYDDLGHLRKTEQRLRLVNIIFDQKGSGEVSQPDKIGNWQMLSIRSSNLRGDVTHAEQWSRISNPFNDFSVDHVPTHLSTTSSVYRADGQVERTQTVADDPTMSTSTQNVYDAQTGQLSSYEFTGSRTDDTPYMAKFTYSYTVQNGDQVVRRISDAFHGLDTTKTYDTAGRLSYERVDLPTPNGSGSDRYEERVFEYDANARIIVKDTQLRLSSSGPDTVPLPTPSTGQQAYVFAGNRTIATIGTDRLAEATKFDFAYTPMSEAATLGTSKYIVQNGDTLISIAEATYGDGALWYSIAQANSIATAPGDFLPASEVGKAYEIPSIIRSTNTASTFKPYDAAEIIGNDRPIIIPPPPPPKHSEIEQILVSAAAITIQVGATVGLSALDVPPPISGAIGAGLGNLAAQGTAWELGMQPPGQQGINWGDVTLAATESYLLSSVGPLRALGKEIWQQSENNFAGWRSSSGPNWRGIAGSLFNIGFDALTPVLGGPQLGQVNSNPNQSYFSFPLGELINSAYNPSSGWAIPGSGKTPVAGAFEYAYNAIANGAAEMGYSWIRDQLTKPSAPPEPPGPRSVDEPRGPLPAQMIDQFDDADRRYIDELDREQIEIASQRRLQLGLQISGLKDRIDHLGENIDDRAIINSILGQQKQERVLDEFARVQREQTAAAARERFALLADVRNIVNDMDQNEKQVIKDMYADGTLMRISAGAELGGLEIASASGVYDRTGLSYGPKRLSGGYLELPTEWLDEVYRRNLEVYKDPQIAESPWPVENIFIFGVTTPALLMRRVGLGEAQTFAEFKKTHKGIQGLESTYRKYLDQQDNEVRASWRRIDIANEGVGVILKTAVKGVMAAVYPVGVIGPPVAGLVTEKVSRAFGAPEQVAAMLGDLARIGTGVSIDPVGSAASLTAGLVTEKVSRAFGASEQTTAILSSIAGVAAAVGASRLTAKASPSVGDLLRAQRATRAEYGAFQQAEQASESEIISVPIAEDMTLYKGIPPQAQAAKAGLIFSMRDMPMPSGAPAMPGATAGAASEVATTAGAFSLVSADATEMEVLAGARLAAGPGMGPLGGGGSVWATASRQVRAPALVDMAAEASGVSNLSRYVDRVTYGGNYSYFNIVDQQRIINLGSGAFARTPVGQILEATHELVHAQQFALLLQRRGGNFAVAKAEFFSQIRGTPNYAADEVIAEGLALQRVQNYLGGVSPQQIGATERYINLYRAMDPPLPLPR